MNAALPPVSIEDVVAMVQPAGKRILAVACGDGEIGAALLAAGATEVVGLDACARGLTRARLGAVYRIDPDAAPELPYPRGYFDVVLIEDLSRLMTPAPTLAHLRGWLADAGRVVCLAPNALHEAALASLLVHGHLPAGGGFNATTVGAALDVLAAAGFTLEDDVILQRTEASPAAESIGRLAAGLGGEPARIADGLTLVRAILAARPTAAGEPAASPFNDPWRGSKNVKVLLVPDLAGGEDWTDSIAEVAHGLDANSEVTLGIPLPLSFLDDPPPGLRRAVDGLRLDVLLTEAPSDTAAWQRLLAGASTVLPVAPNAELMALARLVGVDVQNPS